MDGWMDGWMDWTDRRQDKTIQVVENVEECRKFAPSDINYFAPPPPPMKKVYEDICPLTISRGGHLPPDKKKKKGVGHLPHSQIKVYNTHLHPPHHEHPTNLYKI